MLHHRGERHIERFGERADGGRLALSRSTIARRVGSTRACKLLSITPE